MISLLLNQHAPVTVRTMHKPSSINKDIRMQLYAITR